METTEERNIRWDPEKKPINYELIPFQNLGIAVKMVENKPTPSQY